MTTKRLAYNPPTLKVTRALVNEPDQLYQALVDYSNDIQRFIQQSFASINENFRFQPNSSGNSGYLTLSNGIVLQWLAASANNPGVSNALPIPFPSHAFGAVATLTSGSVDLACSFPDLGHVTVTAGSAGAVNCFVIAVGN